ncbi:MAG: hypothetical protein JXR37_22855 [Kiritimatiellae bacterium]|nr:hypothetical protein [Kiritimatiellia bacterium]
MSADARLDYNAGLAYMVNRFRGRVHLTDTHGRPLTINYGEILQMARRRRVNFKRYHIRLDWRARAQADNGK